MPNYQIITLSTNQEVESEIEMLVADLIELNYTGDDSMGFFSYSSDSPTIRFVFLKNSPITQTILSHNLELPLELDLNDFQEGDLESLQPGTMRAVFFHKQYIREKRKFDNRKINYEVLVNLPQAELNKIPFFLYEHLYEYFMEDDELEIMYSFTTIAIKKKKVPRALANVTTTIIEQIEALLVHNEDIVVLRKIVEEGFMRKEFGPYKQGNDSEGNPIQFFETTLTSFTHQEQKILFCGVIKDKDTWQNKSVCLKSSKGFWQLLLFICASYNKQNVLIHFGTERFIEINFGKLYLIFELTDKQLYQITFNILR